MKKTDSPRPTAARVRRPRRPKSLNADKFAPKHGNRAGVAHVPTEALRGQIEGMARVGTPHHTIAALLKMRTSTLLKYYRAELDAGAAAATYEVCKALYKQCQRGNVRAQIFYLRCMAGWSVTTVEQTQWLDALGDAVQPPTDAADAIRSFVLLLQPPQPSAPAAPSKPQQRITQQ